MRIRKTGRVTDGLWCLGSEASNIYLLEGDDESMIVSGGMSYLVPTLLEQFQGNVRRFGSRNWESPMVIPLWPAAGWAR